jgi:RNA polymerase sigma-70 factor (sigma-E family)
MAPITDEAAFDDFVRNRTAPLLRAAYLLTRDHQLAEDLVQTALFKAARAWERIEGDPEPYVRRILYTQHVSWWRRRRVTETFHSHEISGHDADVDLQLSLEHALERLTAKQRAVIVLRYYEDLTETQAAQVLGIRPGTVKSVNRQALARLRVLSPDLGELIGADHD